MIYIFENVYFNKCVIIVCFSLKKKKNCQRLQAVCVLLVSMLVSLRFSLCTYLTSEPQ